jgi:hypothetical protein
LRSRRYDDLIRSGLLRRRGGSLCEGDTWLEAIPEWRKNQRSIEEEDVFSSPSFSSAATSDQRAIRTKTVALWFSYPLVNGNMPVKDGCWRRFDERDRSKLEAHHLSRKWRAPTSRPAPRRPPPPPASTPPPSGQPSEEEPPHTPGLTQDAVVHDWLLDPPLPTPPGTSSPVQMGPAKAAPVEANSPERSSPPVNIDPNTELSQWCVERGERKEWRRASEASTREGVGRVQQRSCAALLGRRRRALDEYSVLALRS